MSVPKGNYLDPRVWLRGLIQATIRCRPRVRMWEWIDLHVVIPEESGGPCTGRMRTSRVPIFRGLYDIVQQRHVHFFTFCASARIGKTLFAICAALYWIAERFGWAIWLDPTRSSANKLVRAELDEFLLQCEPVRKLAIAAPPHPASKKFWTTLVKAFRGKFFRIIGSGAEADLHGFNAELAVINEKDRCRRSIERDAASDDKIIARTKLFAATRLILENSTPGEGGELSPTWQNFLARSQRYCYLPCPHCSSASGDNPRRTGSAVPEQTGDPLDSEPPERRFKTLSQCPKSPNTETPAPVLADSSVPRRVAARTVDSNLRSEARESTRKVASETEITRFNSADSRGGQTLPLNTQHSTLNTFVPPSWDEVEPGRSPLSYEPWLAGWQRLTFRVDKKLVPFDENHVAFPKGTPREKWREEITGQFKFSQFAIYEERARADDPTKTAPVKVGYDIDAVEHGTTYECAHCKHDIEWTDLAWMEDRFWWVKHNPYAPRDKESAHCWSAYNPFEYWGLISKEFLEAKGDISALIKWHNFTLGLPYIRAGVAIKEDDLDRVIARTPVRYVQGQIPKEAEILTVTVDVQDLQMWFVIRAWGVVWDHPDWPSWSALIDWGEAVSWTQILEYCGLIAAANNQVREFRFILPDGSTRTYVVTAGLVDSGDGDKTKEVYEFCLAYSEVFSPYKGCDQSKTRGNTIRIAPILDEKLDLLWAWSDFFAANLYYDCIKDGATMAGPVYWWLPTNIDRHYREQLTDEFYGVIDGKKGFHSRKQCNHLGDCEKMQRVLAGTVEEYLDEVRSDRREAEAAKVES